MLDWCGEFGSDCRLGWNLSPCWFETGASAVILVTFIAQLAFQWCKATDLVVSRKKGVTGTEACTVGGSALLACMHVGHLVSAALSLQGLYFHALYHGVFACLWLAVAIMAYTASKPHTLLDLRPFATVATAAYTWSIVSYFQIYLSPVVYPVLYVKAQLWTSLLQALVTGGIAVLHYKQVRAAREAVRAGGYQPLPDVENAVAAVEDERTWVSLFADACKYVWPESWALRLRVIACILLLVIMRVLNLAVPIFYKRLVDVLATASSLPPEQRPSFRTLMDALGGGGIVGMINNLRQYLWIPVSQDAYRRVTLRVFSHVLDLDLNFHLKRRTGEVTKVVDRGTAAIQNVLSTVVFSILPQIFDMLAAATYLAQALEPWIAIIVFITIGSYIPMTIAVTEWRGNFRREMNRTENYKSARATDALLNWETVKYFNNEDYEVKQFAGAIADYQNSEYRFSSSLNALNVLQSCIMFLGIASGVTVCVAGVSRGTLSVGDVVLFLTMMAQLYAPLNWFGTYYRIIQQYMIDMENLFQLLDKNAAVKDAPGAVALKNPQGNIEFDNVGFSYETSVQVLKSVCVSAKAGSTIAFVGATGSGKSTMTRLLFRFYDVTAGAVKVDGTDIRGLTQNSLRAANRHGAAGKADCVLFNDTILHNIRYGRIDATDEEVFAAARAASIHDAILRFPKAYETVVGERGLRLSGGEKQRVAFARAILKNPQILVLDEATSALDTITEKRIQAALKESRAARTTVIVAHRLSTISDADLIVVMREGAVAEMGSHQELLALNGLYAELWSKQAVQGSDSQVNIADLVLQPGNGTPGGAEQATRDTSTSTTGGSQQSLQPEARPSGDAAALLPPQAPTPGPHDAAPLPGLAPLETPSPSTAGSSSSAAAAPPSAAGSGGRKRKPKQAGAGSAAAGPS